MKSTNPTSFSTISRSTRMSPPNQIPKRDESTFSTSTKTIHKENAYGRKISHSTYSALSRLSPNQVENLTLEDLNRLTNQRLDHAAKDAARKELTQNFEQLVHRNKQQQLKEIATAPRQDIENLVRRNEDSGKNRSKIGSEVSSSTHLTSLLKSQVGSAQSRPSSVKSKGSLADRYTLALQRLRQKSPETYYQVIENCEGRSVRSQHDDFESVAKIGGRIAQDHESIFDISSNQPTLETSPSFNNRAPHRSGHYCC